MFAVAVAVSATPIPIEAATAFAQTSQENSAIQVSQSYHNDVSPVLRDLPLPGSLKEPKPVMEHGLLGLLLPDIIPPTILNFDGIPFPGVACFCTPPDANGAVGLTQYVQVVNQGYQVFNKATGASVLGPAAITAIWSGFGGVCQNEGGGDPLILYDQIANRWLISQFAGASAPTDACIAVSTTSDATGSWNRYAFHLGNNLFIEPKLSVWPDGYYMSTRVFKTPGGAFLGPQAFAFDRAKMLSGLPATAITPGITGGPAESPFLPADFDGSILPPSGAPNSLVAFPSAGIYKIWHFHVDFVTPANSAFTLFASPPAAAFTPLCPATQSCVPQLGTTTALDGVGNRLMFRLVYRNFGSPSAPNESIVGNFSVASSGVAGLRWFELKNVTFGPVTVAQESTYQPDATWRWLGSAGMDQAGNLAIGFSASSAAIHPQIRYAGRLATDPPNTLAQGEAHLFDGSGSSGSSAWGAFSALTIDPVDDCTFWYTNEYYDTTNWRTRIGSFKFAQCNGSATPTPPPPSPTITPSPTPTPTLTPTPTPSPSPTPSTTPNEPHFEVSAPTIALPSAPFDITVTAKLFNNVFTGYTGTVHFTSTASSGAHLPPDSTLTNGVGTFSVTFDVPGNYTITARDTVNPSMIGTSGTIFVPVIDPGTPPPISPTASPMASPSATASPTATPTPTLAPPTPTPTPTPAAQAINLSTRLRVQTGDNAGIAGFIITGTAPKQLLFRGIGPSLAALGVPDALANPTLDLRRPDGTRIRANDNWQDDPAQAATIQATGLPPQNNLEAAIIETLDPGSYTVILRGMGMTTGVGLVEVYDVNQGVDSKLANLSTRAFVDAGNNIVIAGFVMGGNTSNNRIVARGIGPSLTAFGVANALTDPTLELRDSSGTLLASNNDWQDNLGQAEQISAAGLAPTNNLESAIAITLPHGAYTALLAGLNNGTGVGVVEIYDRGPPP